MGLVAGVLSASLLACGESTRERARGSANGGAPGAGAGALAGSGGLAAGAGGASAAGASSSGGTGGASSGGAAGGDAGSAGSGNRAGFDTINSCAAPRPCPGLSTVQGAVNRSPTPDELRCVLESLRDGTPGVYDESLQTIAADATSNTLTRYVVHGDRTYDRIQSGYGAGSRFESGPHRCTLPPPEHFAACLEALDAATTPGNPDTGSPATTTYRFSDCGAGTDCVEAPGTCP